MSRGRRDHEVRVHKLRDLAAARCSAVRCLLASRQPPVGGKPTVRLFGRGAAHRSVGAGDSGAGFRGVGRHRRLRARASSGGGAACDTWTGGSLRRTSVLVGALSTAIAMMVAVGIMVGSFRQTVLLWMDDRLQADLYISPASSRGRGSSSYLCPPDTVGSTVRTPGGLRSRSVPRLQHQLSGACPRSWAAVTRASRPAMEQAVPVRRRPESVFRQMLDTRRGRRQRALRQQAPRSARRHALTLPLGGRKASPSA